jgi:hypothetical protein
VGFAPYRPYPFFRRLAPWRFHSLGCWSADYALTLDTVRRISHFRFEPNSTEVLASLRIRLQPGRRPDTTGGVVRLHAGSQGRTSERALEFRKQPAGRTCEESFTTSRPSGGPKISGGGRMPRYANQFREEEPN